MCNKAPYNPANIVICFPQNHNRKIIKNVLPSYYFMARFKATDCNNVSSCSASGTFHYKKERRSNRAVPLLPFSHPSRTASDLQRLVEAGNTVVVIEHNLDVIKTADYLIDLGPEGGDGGGTIVVTGTPEEVAACPASYTGQYLKRLL